MSTEDLENYEAERELQLAQEYQDVASMFRYAVETERRFYLANEVSITPLSGGERPLVQVELRDAWVLDGFRTNRFLTSTRVFAFKDVVVEELATVEELPTVADPDSPHLEGGGDG